VKQYRELLYRILTDGVEKTDRTGTGTLSIFGHQMRFDLTKGFPLVTTKKVFTKAIIAELLWFIEGSTDNNRLRELGSTIWDEWAKEDGSLGPIYGKQWRSWDLPDHKHTVEKTSIDQLANVIQRIKTNPDCRRLIVSAWNPADIPDMALAPCHCLFQFNTRPIPYAKRCDLWHSPAYIKQGEEFASGLLTEDRLDQDGIPRFYLDLRLDQRSADVFLGVPFNIASYALLLSMVAQVTNTVAGDFVHQFGDVHIYKNHFDQVRLQLSRAPLDLPTLWLNPEVKDIDSFRFEDIRIEGYESHPAIKAPVAV